MPSFTFYLFLVPKVQWLIASILFQNNVSREDLVKPTNPIAQKAALSSHNQYKVSPRPMARIKPKVLNTVPKEKVCWNILYFMHSLNIMNNIMVYPGQRWTDHNWLL